MDRPEPGQARPLRSKARRSRAARACDVCRQKKNKCDENMPCDFCRHRGLPCVYKDGWGRSDESTRVRELEQKVKFLADALAARDQNNATTSPVAVTYATPGLPTQPGAIPLVATTPDAPNAEDIPMPLVPMPLVPTPSSTATERAGKQEVSGINAHTKNVEFYGTSSSVALLSHIQRNEATPAKTQDGSNGSALLSSLHNPALHTSSRSQPTQHGHGFLELLRPSHYRSFLDGYFAATHYIHPILEKEAFLHKCEILWSGPKEASGAVSSFDALYYSVLSLGALIGAREEESVQGISNIRWSRIFFQEARGYCNDLGMTTDLEMVQCYFFMAKVCQNELSPHLSYMYVGQAVRTALAIGINRDPGPKSNNHADQLKAESRTWWGLYALETEMSFASGRPDTLGADVYHTRSYPLIRGDPDTEANPSSLAEPPHCGIIEHLVKLSRITRAVCLGIYQAETSLYGIMDLAYQIERDLLLWASELPDLVRPDVHAREQPSGLKSVKHPQWAKRQRLVLTVRYHNLRVLLFGSLLLNSSLNERRGVPGVSEAIKKCMDSATLTIQLMYQTYQHNDFFRTWFYNTTYTVFAASLILVYVRREAPETEKPLLLTFVDMAVEVLEIMDECVVALQAANLLRHAKEKAQMPNNAAEANHSGLPHEGNVHINHYWGALDLLDNDMDLNFAFQLGDMDVTASMFAPLPGNPHDMLGS